MDPNAAPFRIVTVAMTEMQVRFPSVLFASPPTVTCVTYLSTPVVAIIPLAIITDFIQFGENTRMENVTMTTTQVRILFQSYSQRLAPLLEAEDTQMKAIEVTRRCGRGRRERVGMIVPWTWWERYQTEKGIGNAADTALVPQHTFTISEARHRLFLFAEQFAQETEQGILRPVIVENYGEPVFAVVPWRWYQLMTNYVKSQSPVPFRVKGDCEVEEEKRRENPDHSSQTRE